MLRHANPSVTDKHYSQSALGPVLGPSRRYDVFLDNAVASAASILAPSTVRNPWRLQAPVR